MGSRQLTLTIDEHSYALLEREGLSTGETPDSMARTLIEEGLRMQAHPDIVFRSGPAGRRPGLMGGPDVWEVARVLRELDWTNPEDRQLAEQLTGQSARLLNAAQGYYTAYRDEIDAWLHDLDEYAEAAFAASLPENRR